MDAFLRRCDPWEVLWPEDPGYTYDCHRNQMLPWNGYRSRLDRHAPCNSRHADVVPIAVYIAVDINTGVLERNAVNVH